MKSETPLIFAPDISRLICNIRGQRVILDSDLAAIDGVRTKALNQAVKRNLSRFPSDFVFQLKLEELNSMRSQIVTAYNQSQVAAGSKRNVRYPPLAFTEHSALMAANILNSARTVAMSVYVIRAFVKMREDLVANAAILKRLAEIDKTLLIHDVALREIWEKLRPLLEPPPLPPKPEIGFHIKEEAIPYSTTRKVARA